MTTYRDLSPCDYFGPIDSSRLLAVGWLGPEADYPTGDVPIEFFRKLLELSKRPWEPIGFLGGYGCELCRHQFTRPEDTTFESMPVPAASGTNLFVPNGSVIYVAPVVIAHYIDVHWYHPPDEFIAAVVACPEMRSVAYYRLLLASGGREMIGEMKAWTRAIQAETDPDRRRMSGLGDRG